MASEEKEHPQQQAAQASTAAAAKPSKKTRVHKPERPNRDIVNKEIEEVNSQIAACQKRIQEIKDAFDNQKQGRQTVDHEVQEARRQLAGTIAQFKVVMDQKRVLRDELGAADEARKRLRDEAKALRDRLPFVQVDQIDAEIQKVEYRMAHASLTLQEEKRAVQQISELRKTKEWVKEYTQRMDRISADENSRTDLLAKIKEKDEQLTALRNLEQQQKAAVDALRTKSRISSEDLPVLAEEREKKYAEIKVLKERIRALNDDFRERENQYWEKEREWRAQQAEDKKKAFEEREAWRKEKEAKRLAWEAENYVEPFTDEIIMCDQLVAYMEKLRLPGAEEGVKDEDGERKMTQVEGFGKMVVSKKKGDDELEGFFGGMGKGKKKKGANRVRDRGERFVSHSLDAIASFGKVKITPPTRTADFEETIGKIKEKKAEFQRMQVEQREKKLKGLAAEGEMPSLVDPKNVSAVEEGENNEEKEVEGKEDVKEGKEEEQAAEAEEGEAGIKDGEEPLMVVAEAKGADETEKQSEDMTSKGASVGTGQEEEDKEGAVAVQAAGTLVVEEVSGEVGVNVTETGREAIDGEMQGKVDPES